MASVLLAKEDNGNLQTLWALKFTPMRGFPQGCHKDSLQTREAKTQNQNLPKIKEIGEAQLGDGKELMLKE